MNNKGYALAKIKKYDEALKNIEKSLELQPELANTLDSKGYTFRIRKKWRSITYVQKAIEIDPKDPKLQYNAGKVYQKLQKNNEALECLNNALKLDPNCEEAQKVKDEILSNN